ncbi:hypothetical protein BMF94_6700 [Rhodotorula taiwanensis]|uniref:Uncharacterized protein n=1 Tax=Rhodotorula taiwanensis TaxID=741276 RepID=A0A2S5B0W2_9BASI|nr:hypothetical protein BMF94_6700 [Rhodotorula taiwanensis]
MPSYAAWAGATLYCLYCEVLSAPVSILVESVLPGQAARPTLAALRWPFWMMATLALWIASLVQTGVLVEEWTMDGLGTALNSRLASTSHPQKNASGLIDSLLLAESPSSSMAYTETLSALLDVPLPLPVQSGPPNAEPFSEKDVREWNDANEVLRLKMERGMEESAARWLDVLEWVPTASASGSLSDGDDRKVDPASSSSSQGRRFERFDYLAAVLAELEAVNSRKPTRHVYARHVPSAEEWHRLERAERAAKERQAGEREARFQAWLDAIMTGASPFTGRSSAGAGDDDTPPRSDKDLEAERQRRAMLDVPLAGPGQPGLTWRDQLREQWALIFDTAQGGVLGNVERALEALGGDSGLDADEEDGSVWTPDPVQIMAAHHMRAQVASTLAGIDSTREGSRFPPDDPEWERATLPTLLDTVSNEHMSLEQLAIRVDRRARRWADRFVDLMTRKSVARSRSPTAPTRLSIRERTQLLRDSPFPAFMRSVDSTFKAPRDPAHFRIGISPHDLANAIFAIRTDGTAAMAPRPPRSRGQEEGGVSAVQRELWRRAASDEELEVVRRQLAAEQGAKSSERAGPARVPLSRDEL